MKILIANLLKCTEELIINDNTKSVSPPKQMILTHHSKRITCKKDISLLFFSLKSCALNETYTFAESC